MPMYEYQCAQCGRRTEKRQKFSDAPLTECPHCGGPLTKVISAPAVQFKGGGWYADGYGSKKPAAGGSAEGGSSSAKAESGSSAAKSEGSGSATSDAGKSSAAASSDSSSSSAASSAGSSGGSSTASASSS